MTPVRTRAVGVTSTWLKWKWSCLLVPAWEPQSTQVTRLSLISRPASVCTTSVPRTDRVPSSGWTGSRAASLTRDAMVSPSRRGGGSHSARVAEELAASHPGRGARPSPARAPRAEWLSLMALLKSPRPLQGLALICPNRSRWLGSRRMSQRWSFPGQNGCRLPGTSGVELRPGPSFPWRAL